MEIAVKNLILIGDRVLIQPHTKETKTKSGLYLPPGVQEKEKIQKGRIVRVGPGYALPTEDFGESWKTEHEQVRYLPLQAQEGDCAIFLLNDAHKIRYQNETYFIVRQASILMLEREEELFTT